MGVDRASAGRRAIAVHASKASGRDYVTPPITAARQDEVGIGPE